VSEPFWERNLILKVVCGSRAHGLATEQSDTDTRGVCIPPARFLLGLSRFEQHESEGRDHVIFALAKFVRLALQGNPNIIETLFGDPGDVLHVDEHGQRLLGARRLFLSRRVGERFAGYARAQLGRMERHHRWLSDPPEGQPTPAEFGAADVGGRWTFPDTDAEKAYRAALKHHDHYRTWRRDRNPERAALEARHGYDTKHAQHLCRLLRMGAEVLEEGVVRVRRPDAEWLRGIRRGMLGYDELLELVRRELELLPGRVAVSPLPEEPDTEAAEALVIDLQENFLRLRGVSEV